MSLTKRKRRSDFGVKRGPLGSRKEQEAAAQRRRDEYRDRELRELAAFSDARLRALVAAIDKSMIARGECVEAPRGGLSEVYDLEHVAHEVARRGWAILIPTKGQGGVSPP